MKPKKKKKLAARSEIADPLAEHYEHITKSTRLLPAWFVPRMMDDNWFFGLLLTTGQTLAISQIDGVCQAADGSIWLKVTMLDETYKHSVVHWENLIGAPTSRLTASINAAHVVCAVELADT